MRKMITIRLIIMAVIGVLVVGGVFYFIQTMLSDNSAAKNAELLTSQIKEKIIENEEAVAELKQESGHEYIIRARAAANVIAADPSIVEDFDKINKLVKALEVEELHITDSEGVIRWGTTPTYYGFDFASGEQSAAFLPMLTDKSFELAQDPTPTAINGKMFQYVGVARIDAPGIIQVGISPTRLDEKLEGNSLDAVLANYKTGENGFCFAVNIEDETILTFPDDIYIGTPVSELGLKMGDGHTGFFKYNGLDYFYYVTSNDSYYIVSTADTAEMYASRLTTQAVTSVLFILIFAIIIGLIAFFVQRIIVKGVENIISGVEKIDTEDNTTRLMVKNAPEFIVLSNQINDMVDNIHKQMSETDKLMVKQTELLKKITSASNIINNYSGNMSDISRTIAEGATSQAESVTELNEMFNSILTQVQENSKSTMNAKQISEESEQQLSLGMDKLYEMNTAMDDISVASQSISQVIKAVSDIAFQTNILALNASVEAARAGAHGKGFAVVAQEVRNLAIKTTEAANNTTDLIETALSTVSKGQTIAKETSKAMEEVLEGTKKSAELINEITVATEKQADAIESITIGMRQISNVIQDNARISTEAENTSDKLSEQVNQLEKLVRYM